MFNEELGSPFIIAHSVSFVKSDMHSVAVLLLRVEKDELDTKGSGFHITLEWVTIAAISKEGKCFTFILLVSNVQKKKNKICFYSFVLEVDCSSSSDISFPQNFSLDFTWVVFSYILRSSYQL